MFLETTPDTSGYMIAGYLLTFVTLGIYIVSMYIRNRNLKQDIETLASVQTEKPKITKKQ